MTETPSVKAHRLVEEGRVSLLASDGEARRFEVVGNTGTYLVRLYPEAWTCTCPAVAEFRADRCSHELAAILHWSVLHRDGNVVNPTQEGE